VGDDVFLLPKPETPAAKGKSSKKKTKKAAVQTEPAAGSRITNANPDLRAMLRALR
jgi:hypothetical protein